MNARLGSQWPALATGAVFLAAAIGLLLGLGPAESFSGYLFYWWSYELLGCFYLIVYLAFVEEMFQRRWSVLGRLLVMSALFVLLAVVLHLLFPRLPQGALLTSGILILPGYIRPLVVAGDRSRRDFLYSGGRALCMLLLSFFPMMFIASLAEKAGVRMLGREAFDTTVSLAWGSVYQVSKALMEAAGQGLMWSQPKS